MVTSGSGSCESTRHDVAHLSTDHKPTAHPLGRMSPRAGTWIWAARARAPRAIAAGSSDTGAACGRDSTAIRSAAEGDEEEPTPSRAFDEAFVRAKLEDGRAQGQRLRWLVQTPTLIVGGCVTVVAVAFLVLYWGSPFGSIPVVFLMPTCMILLLSVLPTDHRVCIALSAILALVSMLVGILFAHSGSRLAIAYVTSSGCAARGGKVNVGTADGSSPPACRYALSDCCVTFAYALGSWAICARLVRALVVKRSARSLLLELWQAFAMLALICVVINFVAIGTAAAAGVWTLQVRWVSNAVVTLEQLVIGILTSHSEFRAHAQAVLARHGTAVTTAAAIAALIGDRSAEEVQAAALSRLRCIRLDLVDEEQLASPQPDATLFARSVSAKLGDIDAFISHRHARVRACRVLAACWRAQMLRLPSPPLRAPWAAPRRAPRRAAGRTSRARSGRSSKAGAHSSRRSTGASRSSGSTRRASSRATSTPT